MRLDRARRCVSIGQYFSLCSRKRRLYSGKNSKASRASTFAEWRQVGAAKDPQINRPLHPFMVNLTKHASDHIRAQPYPFSRKLTRTETPCTQRGYARRSIQNIDAKYESFSFYMCVMSPYATKQQWSVHPDGSSGCGKS